MLRDKRTPSAETSAGAAEPVDFYAFGGFRLEVRTRFLFKDNVRVPITTKAFDTLLALVRKAGGIVTKDELISEVWPDTVVTEDSLTQNISALRRILEDDPAQPRFIATVARRGYRFIADVTSSKARAAEDSSQAETRDLQPAHASVIPVPPSEVKAPSTDRESGLTARTTAQWRALRIVIGIVVLLGGVGLGVLLTSNRSSEPLVERRLRFAPELPPDSTLASGGIVSPDGRHVAFIARDRISGESALWIRTLSTGTAYPIPGSNGALRPFWAPDSQAIAFFGGGQLRRANLAGGEPLLICLTITPRPSGGTWNDRGEILFAEGPIYKVSAEGGQPEAVLRPSAANSEISVRWPQFLPGGRRFIYEVLSTDESKTGIYTASLDRPGVTKLLDAAGTQVAYTRGFLIYVKEGRLFARGFDPEATRFTGDPVVVVDATSPNAAVSASETVIALGGGATEEIAEFDRNGQVIRTFQGIPPLRNLNLSRDQRTLVGEAIEPNSRGIWLIDLIRQVPTRVIDDGTWPLLLPEGRTIAFAAARDPGSIGLYLRDMDSGTDRLLMNSPYMPIVSASSSDGQLIAYTMVEGQETRQDIWAVSRQNPANPSRLIASQAREIHPAISPDGRWIAYASDEEGAAFNVYVDAFPGLGQKRRVSTNGGTQPQWRSDSRELFYLSADQTLMSVDVSMNRGLQLNAARPLFQPMILGFMADFRNQYAVSADGNTFLVGVTSVSNSQQPITLIVNWRGTTY